MHTHRRHPSTQRPPRPHNPLANLPSSNTRVCMLHMNPSCFIHCIGAPRLRGRPTLRLCIANPSYPAGGCPFFQLFRHIHRFWQRFEGSKAGERQSSASEAVQQKSKQAWNPGKNKTTGRKGSAVGHVRSSHNSGQEEHSPSMRLPGLCRHQQMLGSEGRRVVPRRLPPKVLPLEQLVVPLPRLLHADGAVCHPARSTTGKSLRERAGNGSRATASAGSRAGRQSDGAVCEGAACKTSHALALLQSSSTTASTDAATCCSANAKLTACRQWRRCPRQACRRAAHSVPCR